MQVKLDYTTMNFGIQKHAKLNLWLRHQKVNATTRWFKITTNASSY